MSQNRDPKPVDEDLSEAVSKIVATWPRFTPERREQLRVLLSDGPIPTTDTHHQMPEAHVYQINRWDCPECGEVHESDAEFDPVEICDSCHTKVTIR